MAALVKDLTRKDLCRKTTREARFPTTPTNIIAHKVLEMRTCSKSILALMREWCFLLSCVCVCGCKYI